jgi:WD40 repeat protein
VHPRRNLVAKSWLLVVAAAAALTFAGCSKKGEVQVGGEPKPTVESSTADLRCADYLPRETVAYVRVSGPEGLKDRLIQPEYLTGARELQAQLGGAYSALMDAAAESNPFGLAPSACKKYLAAIKSIQVALLLQDGAVSEPLFVVEMANADVVKDFFRELGNTARKKSIEGVEVIEVVRGGGGKPPGARPELLYALDDTLVAWGTEPALASVIRTKTAGPKASLRQTEAFRKVERDWGTQGDLFFFVSFDTLRNLPGLSAKPQPGKAAGKQPFEEFSYVGGSAGVNGPLNLRVYASEGKKLPQFLVRRSVAKQFLGRIPADAVLVAAASCDGSKSMRKSFSAWLKEEMAAGGEGGLFSDPVSGLVANNLEQLEQDVVVMVNDLAVAILPVKTEMDFFVAPDESGRLGAALFFDIEDQRQAEELKDHIFEAGQRGKLPWKVMNYQGTSIHYLDLEELARKRGSGLPPNLAAVLQTRIGYAQTEQLFLFGSLESIKFVLAPKGPTFADVANYDRVDKENAFLLTVRPGKLVHGPTNFGPLRGLKEMLARRLPKDSSLSITATFEETQATFKSNIPWATYAAWIALEKDEIRKAAMAAGKPPEPSPTAKHDLPPLDPRDLVRRVRGKVNVIGQGTSKPGISADLRGTDINDADLEHLGRWAGLRRLNLAGTRVSDRGLVHLKGAVDLEDLDLSGTEITDTGMAQLQGLASLKRLGLSYTRVSDDGLRQLSALPALEELFLHDTKVSDRGLETHLPRWRILVVYPRAVRQGGDEPFRLTGVLGGRQLVLAETGQGMPTPSEILFAFRKATRLERLIARWPSGKEQTWTDPPNDGPLLLEEGVADIKVVLEAPPPQRPAHKPVEEEEPPPTKRRTVPVEEDPPTKGVPAPPKSPEVREFLREYASPFDVLTLKGGKTLRVQPLGDYLGVMPKFDGSIEVIPLDGQGKPEARRAVSTGTIERIDYYENLVIGAVETLLQLPPEKAPRPELLGAAEKALVGALSFHEVAKERGLRTQVPGEERLRERLRSVKGDQWADRLAAAHLAMEPLYAQARVLGEQANLLDRDGQPEGRKVRERAMEAAREAQRKAKLEIDAYAKWRAELGKPASAKPNLRSAERAWDELRAEVFRLQIFMERQAEILKDGGGLEKPEKPKRDEVNPAPKHSQQPSPAATNRRDPGDGFRPVHFEEGEGVLALLGDSGGRLSVVDIYPGKATAGSSGSVKFCYGAFSPDGTRFVSAADEYSADIRDARTGEQVAGPFRHKRPGAVLHALFSPDGRKLVTASADGTVIVWDARTGRQVAGPFEHKAAATFAAFSPDGRLVLTSGADGWWVWHLEDGRRVAGDDHPAGPSSFSPDGKRIVTGIVTRDPRWEAVIWDVKTGKRLPLGHPSRDRKGGALARLRHVIFSPDGTLVLTAGESDSVVVWDATTGEVVAGPLKPGGTVVHASFSPDGKRLVTASLNGTVAIWDASKGTKILEVSQREAIEYASFSPDGRRVVTLGGAGAVVYDAHTGKELAAASPERQQLKRDESLLVRPDANMTIRTIPAADLFATGGTTLTETGLTKLAESAEWLRPAVALSGTEIVVVTYGGSDGADGLELNRKRSEAVCEYLKAHGVLKKGHFISCRATALGLRPKPSPSRENTEPSSEGVQVFVFVPTKK